MFNQGSFSVGAGLDERVRIGREGITLHGPVFVHGKRRIRVQHQHSWEELADVRVELVGSSVADKLSAGLNLIDWSSTTRTPSLFGYVVVTLVRRDSPSEPLTVRVPLKLRWRPGPAWVSSVQDILREALRDPSGRERFA